MHCFWGCNQELGPAPVGLKWGNWELQAWVFSTPSHESTLESIPKSLENPLHHWQE